jgi:hypothetical protein
MTKKIFLGLTIIVLLIGIAATLWAFDGCRKAYSKCTEGGCGSASSAELCTMTCSGGEMITCTEPAAQQ